MALTVWAPWSELIARGLKRLETRSWAPPQRLIGSELVIHAASRMPMAADTTPIERVAIEKSLGVSAREWRRLPRAALVAVVTVRGAYRVDRIESGWLYPAEVRGAVMARPIDITAEEKFGDFRPGRWVWALDDIRPLSPIPCVGTQGLWPVKL